MALKSVGLLQKWMEVLFDEELPPGARHKKVYMRVELMLGERQDERKVKNNNILLYVEDVDDMAIISLTPDEALVLSEALLEYRARLLDMLDDCGEKGLTFDDK